MKRRIEKYLFIIIYHSSSILRFIKIKSGVSKENYALLSCTRNHCDVVRALRAAGVSLFWWRIVAMVMPSGVRFAVVVNRKVGDAEVDAGNRRQQTGSNWREPASLSPPTTASRWRGSWCTNKERERKRRRERHCERKTRCTRIQNAVYCA